MSAVSGSMPPTINGIKWKRSRVERFDHCNRKSGALSVYPPHSDNNSLPPSITFSFNGGTDSPPPPTITVQNGSGKNPASSDMLPCAGGSAGFSVKFALEGNVGSVKGVGVGVAGTIGMTTPVDPGTMAL